MKFKKSDKKYIAVGIRLKWIVKIKKYHFIIWLGNFELEIGG